MDYDQTIQYIFDSVPMFQRDGGTAYKAGLETTIALDEHCGHPHRAYRTIHVAGTNGKGSCSHTLAAILQSAGYRVGLYTSPHLVDFRERIRINGKMATKKFVTDFVEQHIGFFEPLHPSFFELTTAMAFCYFAQEKVDVAVIEVGLGGRLDCTNIIRPDLCVITNISFDHTQFLGHTLKAIAGEKAGIIKRNVPVVIGNAEGDVEQVFRDKAAAMDAPIFFCKDNAKKYDAALRQVDQKLYMSIHTDLFEQFGPINIEGELLEYCQKENGLTILTAVSQLINRGYHIEETDIKTGMNRVCGMTGLMGRWQLLDNRTKKNVVCDTGHNVACFESISRQLSNLRSIYPKVHLVLGMVNDKDIAGILSLLPKDGDYYFTRPTIKRAFPEDKLTEIARQFGLKGDCYPSVDKAYKAAISKIDDRDLLFVGGSSYVVADLLNHWDELSSFPSSAKGFLSSTKGTVK
ncbi:MAG: folylpolyglutamate synthase/dihydrofolate synthase family protein [Bacteroidaceae bacterium]|nr:bifunctional folylpolyglutamate synthase/dihydrofolate synthase [Bacteroidaceae bacterium]